MKSRHIFLVAAAILMALDLALSVAGPGHALFVANTALSMITIGILCVMHRRQRKTREALHSKVDRLRQKLASQLDQHAE